jgi:hypothetical protein
MTKPAALADADYKLPPGCADAMRRHYRIDPTNPNDVHFLKDRIADWREDPAKEVDFEKRILAAVRSGDAEFLAALTKAVQPEPGPRLTAIEATWSAFFTLWVIELQCQEWPTKKRVKETATEILQRNRHPIPGKRYWTQIFEATGLSKLPEAPRGRPKKLVN